jgi:hypothetical protein
MFPAVTSSMYKYHFHELYAWGVGEPAPPGCESLKL